jgi:PAS domain S-box-containing protein
LLPFVVLVAFALASLATFFVTRQIVDDQEARLLKERTGEVGALLSLSTTGTQSSLQVLAVLGSLPDADDAQHFSQSAGALVKGNTVAVAVAMAQAGGGFTVHRAVGDSPPPGAALSGDRAALVSRALSAGKLVSGLFSDPKGKRLILAVPAVGGLQSVAYQESVFDPAKVIPPTPDSPYRELRVALYASTTNDPAYLLLTTEAHVPLSGQVDRVPFPVGADKWLLAVGARGPLVGTFARRAPWLLLLGALLLTVLATAVAEALTRRRAYAVRLVVERTAELDETRAFLERLLTAGPVLVERITVPDHEVSYVSPNTESILGVTQGQALSPGFLPSRIHPDDRPGFDLALERVATGSSTREMNEHRIQRGDDSFRWVSAVLVPETNGGDEIPAVLGYVIDIDDRRQAEHAQRDAQQAAESANQSKSDFLSRMSHELRTPLNAVLGFGQLLELESLPPDQRESVDQIIKGGRHLLALINEVLDIARIESGELALSPEAVLASELVHETVDLIRPLADQRGIQLVIDRSGLCDCYVFTDRQRAKQVLLNLLSNAVKYNRPRGTVAVTCEQPSTTRIRIAVTDTGPGIATERLGQLFTPFERLGAEHTDVEGTGIGLALSQRLTQAMGGTLEVDSTLGQGSTFSVELPRVEGPVERYERLNGDAEPAASSGRERHKILHIEDNLSNLKLVERILARRADVEIVPAMHGRLGLELAHEHRPVLVLLDLHLPDMGGEQVLQRLRDDAVTASIPVVIVSADATPGQVQRLLAAGATAYLTKPIDVRELLRILDEVLEP